MGKPGCGIPVMSRLSRFAHIFSRTPSALRAGLLGFGLAFAAADPNLAVAGKAAAPVVQADLQAGTAQAAAGFDRAVAPAAR